MLKLRNDYDENKYKTNAKLGTAYWNPPMSEEQAALNSVKSKLLHNKSAESLQKIGQS